MKTEGFQLRNYLIILTLFLTCLSGSQLTFSQGWYDTAWPFRRAIPVTNSTGAELTEFQVLVTLNESNFNFSEALSDGSDIRVTAVDGQTLIPFWIESWDQANALASVWVRIPSLPTSGITIYIYYGNPSPSVSPGEPVETPPAGPFIRDLSNPIVPAGDPGAGASLLSENIVYDPVTGHYWMAFANYRSGSYGVGLVWSDDPTDASSWNWHGNIYTQATNGSFAPHILFENGLWYVFFAIRPDIVYITCPTINGIYSAPTTVLSPTETWETYRVDEPYVFRRNDGTWILIYMGDAGSVTEQIGYATAANLTGPYTKYSGNPCLPFGPAGSYDAGTVADPWVYEFNGVYYIGYTVSSTKSSPWSTACATTTDWQTFTRIGVIFPVASSGWDSNNSFRGAVTRIGDNYVFSYTGDSYRMGIALQPVYQSAPDVINNPDAVFEFFDGFDTGIDPDLMKWTFTSGNPDTHTSISDGLLTMTATGNTTGTYVRLDGRVSVGPGYVGETRGRHPDQGTNNMIIEVGFAASGFTNTIRLVDDFPSVTNWQRQTITGGLTDGVLDMAQPADQNWHIFRIFRNSDGTAGFQVDNTPTETATTNVPVVSMPQFLMSFGNTNDFIVDWTRIRKWVGSDPVATIGSEEHHTTVWTGLISNDWNDPGNWTAGVPGTGSVISVPGGTNPTIYNGNLAIGPFSEMLLEPGGSVSVTGDLNSNGIVSIGSTLASSGSLIVNGTVTGNITYNRQLQPGDNSAADWHLAAPPVTSNSDANTGKITTLYQWSEPAGIWTTTGITSAVAGRGYNIRQETGSDGVISFTGPLADGDVTVDASSPYADAVGPDVGYFDRTYAAGRSLENPGGKGWNLLGNPYPSAINASAFISANYSATPALSQFDPNYVALYLFDGTARNYYYVAQSTGWPSGNELSETHIQAGQGFFVLAMNDNSAFTFTRAMQEHSTATPMLKSGKDDNRWPGLQLKAKHPGGEVVTTVVYNGSMTAGVDPGYDIGLFKSGQDLEIYTSLALKDNGINYTRQALPLSGADTLVIPVGIDFKDGGEVTFSAVTVPVDGRRFWLEDRVSGTFTELGLKSCTVNLPADTYGTGRFFIIASTNTPTAIERPVTESEELRIWASGGQVIIKGTVGRSALCEMFDMQGRKMLEQGLSDGELNTVEMPVGLHGVIVVKVTDGTKLISRKIILP